MKKYVTGICILILSACSDPPPPPDSGSCDVKAVFAANGCTRAGCHGGGQPYSFDLSVSEPGAELVGRPSIIASCAGRKIIDPANPDSSMLLTLTDPKRHQAPNDCGAAMPLGGPPLSASDLGCLEKWVRESAQKYPSVQPDYTAEFREASPEVYVSKVKYLLSGVPVTQAELDAVTADPKTLRGLVEGWVGPSANLTPEFQVKLTDFLRTALQQDSVGALREVLGFPTTRPIAIQKLRDNLTQSFALTALDIVKKGRPFTEILTTRTWKVTDAMLVLLAYADQSAAELAQQQTVYSPTTLNGNAIPTLDESIRNRVWYFKEIPSDCKYYRDSSLKLSPNEFLRLMFGRIQCRGGANDFRYADLEPDWTVQSADYATFRDVTFVPGKAPLFYDLKTGIRGVTTFPSRIARLGFFTSPVFLDNWPTNADNQFRATTNQTMIVALGATFSPGDGTSQPLLNGLPPTHAPEGTACYGCHRLMDPMRLFFGKSFNYQYSWAETPEPLAPSLAFLGYNATGNNLDDFAQALAQHPRFPVAWVQKLCSYANSQPCDESDPEFLRIVDKFRTGFNLRDLIVELFTSPLVTNAAFTKTYASRRVLVSIARRRHLCAAQSTRLPVAGICGVPSVADRLGGIPDDSFARGQVDPVLTASPSSFHAAATEQLCTAIAAQVVGKGAFKETNPPAAVQAIVGKVMGLGSSHSRYAAAVSAMTNHYTAQLATKTPLAALQETFTLACMTPDAMAVGF